MINEKKFLLLLVVPIILAFLFISCGEDEEGDLIGPDGEVDVFSWLGTLKAGSWAEYTYSDGYKSRMEFLGDDTWQGRQCILLESESTTSDIGYVVMQIWLDKTTMDSVVTFMKEGNEVYRFDAYQTDDVPTEDDMPWEQSNTKKIGEDKYKTPTGKTVKVTKYQTTDSSGISESWVSDEVPFAQVKEISNGEVILSLYDFGTSGAVRSISKQEAENAKTFGFPEIGDVDEPNGNGGIPDNGGNGDAAGIKITVGAGPRPTITVSEPIKSLTMIGGQTFWGFQTIDPADTLASPFKYGVTPAGAEATIENTPDLVAGEVYQITVFGPDFENGDIFDMGIFSFTR